MNNKISRFQETVWDFYAKHSRDLPWRKPESDNSFDPYKIMVSEIMLQQTQVARVAPKYAEFLDRFPTVSSLAQAQFSDVLRVWNGLGYNRRAKFLLESSKVIHEKGAFYDSPDEFAKLPGIGPNTAAAICVYTYNQPLVFIETNIRTVIIHEFFLNRENVHDREIMPIVIQALDYENPREWYWALMDYGAYIKSHYGNAARISSHHIKQSRFEGSTRQIRARILRALLESGSINKQQLHKKIQDERLNVILKELEAEGLITRKNNSYQLD